MPENHRVKFCTGRDPTDSEAQTSAGASYCHMDAAGYRRPHAWSVDSLHRTMGFLMHGLETSDSSLEIHDLVADADQVLDVIVSYHQNAEIIHEDTERLHAVLRKRQSQLLHRSTGETRHRLRQLADRLQGMTPKPAHACPTQAKQHLLAEAPQQHSPAKVISLTQGASTEPRTPTFGR